MEKKKKNIRVFTAKKRKITLTPWNWLDTSTTADVTIIFAPGITDMSGSANDIFPTATAKVQNCSYAHLWFQSQNSYCLLCLENSLEKTTIPGMCITLWRSVLVNAIFMVNTSSETLTFESMRNITHNFSCLWISMGAIHWRKPVLGSSGQ